MKKTKGITSTLFAVALGTFISFSGDSAVNASGIDGKKLYLKHCKTCHGPDGNPTDLGKGLGARKFANPEWQKNTTDEQIIEQIKEGTPEKMLAFKDKLSPEEIKALVPVVRSFGKK